jgi:hypothetical protein
MQLVTGFATPMIASKIAGTLGVPEGAVRKVLSLAVPVVLGAFLKRSSSPGGVDSLASALGSIQSDPLDSLGNMLSGEPSQLTAAASGGSDLLSSILGSGATGTLASKLAGYAGIDASAAGPLLGLAGSMALGGLKKTADDQGLDAAGVARLLESQKGDIAAALPADFLAQLKGTDILGPALMGAAPAAAAPPRAASATPRTPPPPPPPAKGGMTKWIVGLVALALLAWLLTRFLGGPEEVVVEEEAVTEEAPAAAEETPAAEAPAAEEAPAETAAEPAAAPEPAAAAGPLVVDGVDLGASLQGVLDRVSGALAGVTDAASAEAAVTTLTEADTALAGIQTAAAGLPAEGTSALQALVAGALPALKTTADTLLADSTLGPILKPIVDGLLAKLTALAG